MNDEETNTMAVDQAPAPRRPRQSARKSQTTGDSPPEPDGPPPAKSSEWVSAQRNVICEADQRRTAQPVSPPSSQSSALDLCETDGKTDNIGRWRLLRDKLDICIHLDVSLEQFDHEFGNHQCTSFVVQLAKLVRLSGATFQTIMSELKRASDTRMSTPHIRWLPQHVDDAAASMLRNDCCKKAKYASGGLEAKSRKRKFGESGDEEPVRGHQCSRCQAGATENGGTESGERRTVAQDTEIVATIERNFQRYMTPVVFDEILELMYSTSPSYLVCRTTYAGCGDRIQSFYKEYHKFILIPICQGALWTLAVVDIDRTTISLYSPSTHAATTTTQAQTHTLTILSLTPKTPWRFTHHPTAKPPTPLHAHFFCIVTALHLVANLPVPNAPNPTPWHLAFTQILGVTSSSTANATATHLATQLADLLASNNSESNNNDNENDALSHLHTTRAISLITKTLLTRTRLTTAAHTYDTRATELRTNIDAGVALLEQFRKSGGVNGVFKTAVKQLEAQVNQWETLWWSERRRAQSVGCLVKGRIDLWVGEGIGGEGDEGGGEGG